MLVARIREADCVGCAKCLPACPVDSIIGASKWMHTILTEECIGCQLCVEPCPMDCIEMIESPILDGSEQKLERAQKAKRRFAARQQRLIRETPPRLPHSSDPSEVKLKIQADIRAAVERVNHERNNHQ